MSTFLDPRFRGDDKGRSGRRPSVIYVDGQADRRKVFADAFSTHINVVEAGGPLEALEHIGQSFGGTLLVRDLHPDARRALLADCRTIAGDFVTARIIEHATVESLLRIANEGLVDRYLPAPFSTEHALAFFMECDLEAERRLEELREGLVASALQQLHLLAHISGTVIRDINQPLSYMYNDTERLRQLSQACEGLSSLVDYRGNEIAPRDRVSLHDLSMELPGIVDDLHTGCESIRDMTRDARELARLIDAQEAHAAPVSCSRFALALTRIHRPGLEGKYQGDAELPRVAMSSSQLTYVLRELMILADNAEGHVSIRGTASENSVALQIHLPSKVDQLRDLRGCRMILTATSATLETQAIGKHTRVRLRVPTTSHPEEATDPQRIPTRLARS